jgi:hypothetical protein
VDIALMKKKVIDEVKKLLRGYPPAKKLLLLKQVKAQLVARMSSTSNTPASISSETYPASNNSRLDQTIFSIHHQENSGSPSSSSSSSSSSSHSSSPSSERFLRELPPTDAETEFIMHGLLPDGLGNDNLLDDISDMISDGSLFDYEEEDDDDDEQVPTKKRSSNNHEEDPNTVDTSSSSSSSSSSKVTSKRVRRKTTGLIEEDSNNNNSIQDPSNPSADMHVHDDDDVTNIAYV